MARRCELSNKGVMTGNRVSHANNHTRRRFLPNLCMVSLRSHTTGKTYRLRISARALRSVDHRGGLDTYLLKTPDAHLSARARALKGEIKSMRTARQGAEADTPAN